MRGGHAEPAALLDPDLVTASQRESRAGEERQHGEPAEFIVAGRVSCDVAHRPSRTQLRVPLLFIGEGVEAVGQIAAFGCRQVAEVRHDILPTQAQAARNVMRRSGRRDAVARATSTRRAVRSVRDEGEPKKSATASRCRLVGLSWTPCCGAASGTSPRSSVRPHREALASSAVTDAASIVLASSREPWLRSILVGVGSSVVRRSGCRGDRSSKPPSVTMLREHLRSTPGMSLSPASRDTQGQPEGRRRRPQEPRVTVCGRCGAPHPKRALGTAVQEGGWRCEATLA